MLFKNFLHISYSEEQYKAHMAQQYVQYLLAFDKSTVSARLKSSFLVVVVF